MKVWYDDIRTPPDDSWIWCRTNEDMLLMVESIFDAEQTITHLSLDHDMGLDGVDPATPDAHLMAGRSEHDGTRLLRELTGPVYRDVWEWLVESNPSVTVHSMSAYAALRMVSIMRQRGLRRVRYVPFSVNS